MYKLQDAIALYDRVIKLGPPEDMFVQECVKNMENLKEILRHDHPATRATINCDSNLKSLFVEVDAQYPMVMHQQSSLLS